MPGSVDRGRTFQGKGRGQFCGVAKQCPCWKSTEYAALFAREFRLCGKRKRQHWHVSFGAASRAAQHGHCAIRPRRPLPRLTKRQLQHRMFSGGQRNERSDLALELVVSPRSYRGVAIQRLALRNGFLRMTLSRDTKPVSVWAFRPEFPGLGVQPRFPASPAKCIHHAADIAPQFDRAGRTIS